MHACIFCDIVDGMRRSERIYQDERITAFKDIHPAAPVHILIIPNQHIQSVNELKPDDESLVGHMILTARQIAVEQGVSEHGYRLIFNTGRHGGQVVEHLHLHLLAGQRMRHPIG